MATMATNTEAEPTYHGFTLAELKAEAADDWQEIQNDPGQLEAFAKSLSQRRGMAKGKVPAHYTKAAECTHCGSVWLWEDAPDVAMGCPWFRTGGRQTDSTAARVHGRMKAISL